MEQIELFDDLALIVRALHESQKSLALPEDVATMYREITEQWKKAEVPLSLRLQVILLLLHNYADALRGVEAIAKKGQMA